MKAGMGIVIAWLGMLGSTDARTGAQEAPRGGKIRWRDDIQTALADAGRLGRPILVYVTDDG